MVDLHHSLRPTATVPPLQVSEIAARAKRRKRRRQVSATGLAVATVSIAALAVTSLPGSPAGTATVADGAYTDASDLPTDYSANEAPGPTTVPLGEGATDPTAPASSNTGGEPPGGDLAEAAPSSDDPDLTTSSTASTDNEPEGTASRETRPMTTPGIRVSTATTSEWEDGYCMQIEVINDAAGQNQWQVVLDLDGTVATLWNATVVETSGGTFIFSGLEDYNATIQPGTTTSFGTCVDTDAG